MEKTPRMTCKQKSLHVYKNVHNCIQKCIQVYKVVHKLILKHVYKKRIQRDKIVNKYRMLLPKLKIESRIDRAPSILYSESKSANFTNSYSRKDG
jgi:hypothetical protein